MLSLTLHIFLFPLSTALCPWETGLCDGINRRFRWLGPRGRGRLEMGNQGMGFRYLCFLFFSLQVMMAFPALSAWGLHYPSPVTYHNLPTPLKIIAFVKLSSAKFFECTIAFLPGPWLRQKMNLLVKLAQLTMGKLGLGILAVWLHKLHFKLLSTLGKAPNKATNDRKREANRSRDAFSSKNAISSGSRVSNKETWSLNMSSSLLEIS